MKFLRIAFPLLICIGFNTPLFASAKLLIRNVNVIDATGAPVKKNMNVVIENEKIISIEPFSAAPPAKMKILDGSGKYLIPGLWDMHVHWYEKEYFPLFIANGITGVRQMAGNRDILRIRDHHSGDRLIPRHYVASPIIDGLDPLWPNYSWVVRNKRDADQAVKEAQKEHYDFVKVYNNLSRDAYFEIARQCADHHFSFEGHIPFSITATEASATGQKSVEHLSGVLDACSPQEKDLKEQRARIQTSNLRNGRTERTATELIQIEKTALDTFDEQRATRLFETFARYGTYQCPTLVTNYSMAFLGMKDLRADRRIHFLPPPLFDTWKERIFNRMDFRTGEEDEVDQKIYAKEVSLIPMMLRAGVQFLAGTDARNPFCFPGFSLHDELSLLVQAGLTPMQALQSATLNAARFMGKENSFGTVEKGKVADLVLLDANPLENISNTTHISAVIFKGKVYQKSELQKMIVRLDRN